MGFPAATNVSVASTEALTFTLSLLQPATHGLSVEWSLDGAGPAGGTNAWRTVWPQGLGNGTHTVAAWVKGKRD
jgi:hypothetical protein